MAKVKLKVLRGVMHDRKRVEPGKFIELERESAEALNLLASGRVEIVVEAPATKAPAAGSGAGAAA